MLQLPSKTVYRFRRRVAHLRQDIPQLLHGTALSASPQLGPISDPLVHNRRYKPVNRDVIGLGQLRGPLVNIVGKLNALHGSSSISIRNSLITANLNDLDDGQLL